MDALMDLFLQLDSWLSGLVFFFLMFLGWGLGLTVLRFIDHGHREDSSRIEDAALALFGLLLAFCFSGAASRYETRKSLLLTEAIAIGDFATTASMFEPNISDPLRQELVFYVQQRLKTSDMRTDDPAMPQESALTLHSQERLRLLVQQAIREKDTPTLHTPLMNGYNGLTQAHDNRYYGNRNQVPGSIVMVLVIFGVFTTFNMGRAGGCPAGKRFATWLRIMIYAAMVAMVFTVTIDLEQPRRGFIHASKAPLQTLLNSLSQSAPVAALPTP